MARKAKPPTRKTVENLHYRRDEAARKNIPTAEYQSVLDKEAQDSVRVGYERRDRDLDPQLVWRGKREQDWSDLVVHAPLLPESADRTDFLFSAIWSRAERSRHPEHLHDLVRNRTQEEILGAGEPIAPDVVIMTWARDRGFVVITRDFDFSAILAATEATGPSVLQVRAQDVLPDALGQVVLRVRRVHEDALNQGGSSASTRSPRGSGSFPS